MRAAPLAVLVLAAIVAVVLLLVTGTPAAPPVQAAPGPAWPPSQAAGPSAAGPSVAGPSAAGPSAAAPGPSAPLSACDRTPVEVTLVDAVTTPTRRVLLLCAAGCLCRQAGEVVVDVKVARFATMASGTLGLARDPDPTCLFSLGPSETTVQYALTAPVVFRGALVPGLVVVLRVKGGYVRCDGERCSVAAAAADDACWWVIARDATGSVYDASAPLLAGVPAFVPRRLARVPIQPRGVPVASNGTKLVSAACTGEAKAGDRECESPGACTFCDAQSQEMCRLAAAYGACSVYAAVCPVRCAIAARPYAGQTLFVVASDPQKNRPIFEANVPMFTRTRSSDTGVFEPPLSALTAAVATRRWVRTSLDPAVNGSAAPVKSFGASDREYFWAVLRAMCDKKMPYADGYGWSEDAHGGNAPNYFALGGVKHWPEIPFVGRGSRPGAVKIVTPGDAEWADTRDACEGHLHSSNGGAAGGRRYLNYARMNGTCGDAPARARWFECTNGAEFRARAGIARGRRAMTAATGATAASCVKPARNKLTDAFHSGNYDALSWQDVQQMFGLYAQELSALKLALSPLPFSLARRDVEFRALQPRQKVELVARWNEGCTFAFDRGLALQMPAGCGARSGAQSHFAPRFVYGFWPSDRATSAGRTVKSARMAQECVRCPAIARGNPNDPLVESTESVVREERVACRLKYSYYDSTHSAMYAETSGKGRYVERAELAPWQKCDAGPHPDWPGDNGGAIHDKESDGTAYQDGPDVLFFHGKRLDDGLTNYADVRGVVRRRDAVPVCSKAGYHAQWYQAGFPWAPYAKYDPGATGDWGWNPFKVVRSGGPAVSLFNTELRSVVIAPGFAVYVTPHYHGYHASQRTCHGGLPRLGGVPGESARETPAVNVEQCRVGSWTPQKLQVPKQFVDLAAGEEPVGLVLVNDDLGSAWHVAAGDVLVPIKIDLSNRGYATSAETSAFPALVNCLAAWNYCAFPRHWLQRGSTDPDSGDAPPTADVVAGAGNNVRAPTDSVTDFVAHSASLGALTVFRTRRLYDPA